MQAIAHSGATDPYTVNQFSLAVTLCARMWYISFTKLGDSREVKIHRLIINAIQQSSTPLFSLSSAKSAPGRKCSYVTFTRQRGIAMRCTKHYAIGNLGKSWWTKNLCCTVVQYARGLKNTSLKYRMMVAKYI